MEDSAHQSVRLWQQAASLAARAHQGQVRKDGKTPYFAHPFRVAMTVSQVFGCNDPEALVVALLHDTIEDTTVDFDDIEAGFGTRVAECVAALTKNKALREDVREKEYDERLSRADWRARLVKLADTFDNFSDQAPMHGDGSAQLARLTARCERAIHLAEQDAGAHEETRRAIAAVRSLISND